MERESFEDEETARQLNDRFLSIGYDREERPDLDHPLTCHHGWV